MSAFEKDPLDQTRSMDRRTALGTLAGAAVALGAGSRLAWPAATAAAAPRLGYPAPRWAAYLKEPKTVADILPHARALVRNKATFGGNSPGIGLGMLNRGDEILAITDTTADQITVEAVRQAMEERGIRAHFIANYTLAGVSRQEAELLREKTEIRSANEGFMEAKYYWIERVWNDPEVAKQYLKKRNPALLAALYPERDAITADEYTQWKRLSNSQLGASVRDYLAQYPNIKGVYWGKPGGAFYQRAMAPYESKFYGRCSFTNRWEVISQVSSFPADVWSMIERKTLAPIGQIEQVHVTDPEGTDLGWEVTPEMAARWAQGAYWRGHLMMYPDSATGQYGFKFDGYPARYPHWIPRSPTARASGVVAGSNGSGGFWPHMAVHFEKGYIQKVEGGGNYGQVIREFLDYPKINTATYPYYDTPGYWHLWEVALGTEPKYFRNPKDMYGGGTAGIYCLTYERYRSGVFHWGLGNEMASDPGSLGAPKHWEQFCADHQFPSGHDFHLQNYFVTYRARLRGSKSWVTLVDRGHLTALDDPEVRKLAARYGNPDDVLAEAWIPDIPGINAPGSYAEYSRNPWPYASAQMQKILNGTYPYYFPREAAGNVK